MKRTRSIYLWALVAALFSVTTASGQYRFAVEANHSSVSFAVPIAGGMTKVRGSFPKFTAEMIHDENDISKWSVKATMEVASINTGIAARDKDLQGKAFFDAENHPQIIFESKRIEKRGDKYVAHGDLTIRGVTKPFALEFVFTRMEGGGQSDERPTFGVTAKGIVNRLDFGVAADWKHTVIPNFIGEQIEVEIDLWTRGGQKITAPGISKN